MVASRVTRAVVLAKSTPIMCDARRLKTKLLLFVSIGIIQRNSISVKVYLFTAKLFNEIG